MARQLAEHVENSFVQGLVSDATGLNYPENACTETYNCVFSFDGSVTRRLGFEFEGNHGTKSINRSGAAVSSYVWRNSGTSELSLFVLQVGATVYFYEMDDPSGTISSQALSSTVALTGVSGAPDVAPVECQFTEGNGLLFILHPYCDPRYVSYNPSTQTVTATTITLKIRDFEGATADPYGVDERPTSDYASLNVHHKYNLLNQGWTTANLTTWDGGRTDMPSNADVMWYFKNASDAFDLAVVNNQVIGNTAAPKGHFILTLANQDRNTASGLTGLTSTTSGYQRPRTAAFFAGRVFYSGIEAPGYTGRIYFTQIVERNEQYAFCYQNNDPTSEEAFDLLPSDGGVIYIPEAGEILKLVSLAGSLLVFATNGIWNITGSGGLGFVANDYVVQKISSISTLSATSFVDVGGYPAWWNTDGIYMISSDGANITVKPLSDRRITNFFKTIPQLSKKYARGAFNILEGAIHWLYRSTEASTIEQQYEFDRVLIFNTLTGAFYPWTISSSGVKVNSIQVSGNAAGVAAPYTVTASGGDVVDSSGNTVVVYRAAGGAVGTVFKYVVSYPSGESYLFTFAEAGDDSYKDWTVFGTAADYTSYFVSGYKVHGGGIRKFQSNYVRMYSRNTQFSQTAYTFQAMWDYSNTSATNRWSPTQTITHNNPAYDTMSRRLKIRGNGLAVQFRVSSVSGVPFDIVGWATRESGNAIP